MISMTITTAFAVVPIEVHSACGLISMIQFPPMSSGPRRKISVQFEVDGQVKDDIHGLAVERTRFEFPAFHGIDGGLIESERQRLEDLNVRNVPALVDDALDDDDAGDASLAGHFGIHRLDAVDHDRRLDVAADAQRSFDFRRGVSHYAANHPTDHPAHHAAFYTTFDAALSPGIGGRRHWLHLLRNHGRSKLLNVPGHLNRLDHRLRRSLGWGRGRRWRRGW